MTIRKISLLAILLLSIVTTAFGQAPGSDVVKAQGSVNKDKLVPGSTFRLAVVLDIAEGYHIGSASPDALWPMKLNVSAPAGVTFGKPEFPKDLKIPTGPGQTAPSYEGKVTIYVPGRVSDKATAGKGAIKVKVEYQPCTESSCFAPAEVNVSVPAQIVAKDTKAAGAAAVDTKPVVPNATDTKVTDTKESAPKAVASSSAVPAEKPADTPRPASEPSNSPFKKGLFIGFLTTFGFGLLLSFSPCVYPLIPVTIGYFGTQAAEKKSRLVLLASLYVLGLALMYSILGTVAALTGKMFGWFMQSPYIPIGIAVVLVALALSMFGLYEFRVPTRIASASQAKAGPAGALLMGLLFGIVCAPCAGPVVVALMTYVAAQAKPVLGFSLFFVLALGMGLPYFVLAMFSGSINKIPQAGMWMVSVKKVLGLLLLGAAIYYVSPLIEQHVSMKIGNLALPSFMVVSGVYLGCFEKALAATKKTRFVRQFAGLAVVGFGIVSMVGTTNAANGIKFQPYSDAVVAKAVASGKPVMIDFTANWCTYCKIMEKETFPNPAAGQESRRFVVLKADQSEAKSPAVAARAKKYSVTGLPTIVFLDSRGNEVKEARITDKVGPKELIEKMKLVR